ncbi:uncharacterized protein LOC105423028 [Pogonomyrmex barbatus]|uniref:Uncharacterized protein LOC105423028 n=1 Tax=Pogonomyrmex barbatus TaxID=144034 RepID=A0A6I9VVR4_9HYME|nr:uncharacterized protein LOC105423028 [Pogonomyrmex barbatus]
MQIRLHVLQILLILHIVQRDYFMDSYNSITMRECAKSCNNQKKCYQGRYTRDSHQLICECLGYGCNRSQQCSFNSVLYLVCILFVVVNYHFRYDYLN